MSGRPFTDWTRDSIFSPLGMTSTHFHLDHTEIVRDRAYSYDGDRGEGFRNAPLNYANVGATSLFTTVEDMANWIRNYEDKKVGGPAVWDKMLTKGKLSDGTEIDYARGIMHGIYRGLKTIGHSGGDAGFAQPRRLFPRSEVRRGRLLEPGFVRSRRHGHADRRYLSGLAARRGLSGAQPTRARRRLPPPPPDRSRSSAESLEAFAGTYWLESNLVRKLVVDKDKLVYVRSSDNTSDLAPLSPTRFKMLGVPGEVFLEFTDKAGGLYNAFTFTEANGARIGAKRIEPFEPTEAQLREYAGTFIRRSWTSATLLPCAPARSGSSRV